MLISIGTTSASKEKYVREALIELGITDADLAMHEVSSGVSDQPLSSEETRLGAGNRARAALAACPEAAIAIGVEVGYERSSAGKFGMLAWAVIFNGETLTEYRSHVFPLPRFHNEVIKQGGYLGDRVRAYVQDARSDIGKKLGMVLVERDTVIKTALYHALLIFFNKGEF